MADTLFNVPLYRERIRTSIYGARLALDDDNMLVGPAGLKRNVRTISTTVVTSAYPHGVTRIAVSGSSQGPTQHTLPAPIPGITATFTLVSTSTGSQQFLFPSGVTVNASSLGATVGSTVLNAVGPGGTITLIGLTTAQWGVFSRDDITSTGLARAFTFTTST
jgi:hypothetical protein